MDVLSKAVENGQEIDPALFADEKSNKSLKLRLINRATWGVVLSVVAIVMLACALFVNYGHQRRDHPCGGNRDAVLFLCRETLAHS